MAQISHHVENTSEIQLTLTMLGIIHLFCNFRMIHVRLR